MSSTLRGITSRGCAVLIGLNAACHSKTTTRETPGPLGRAAPGAAPAVLPTAGMPRIATIDERYPSYNVGMLEVAGGSTTPGSPPIDLANTRLRALAAGLGPAYVRVSGTWANATYFPPTAVAPKQPPSGFSGVLTHQRWEGLVDFARAVDASIVTSFAISPGTRDATGVWTADQARRLLDHMRSIGGSVGAVELMNEPNAAAMGGAPKGYDAEAYGRDFRVFRSFVKQAAPGTLIAGPGSVGELELGVGGLTSGTAGALATRDLLTASGPGLDVFSYHHYGAASRRCETMGMPPTRAEEALSEGWLSRTDATLAFYRALRDEFEPGKPLWLTETADAACGGNPWGSTFLDSFRYLDQLGRLAKQGVQMVAHNSLVAGDSGLIDDKTLTPRPNYWAALLWRRLMGATVLDSGITLAEGQHVYAHCLRGKPGGVALLVINTDRDRPHAFRVPVPSERFTLHASELESRQVRLNGSECAVQNDALPTLTGTFAAAGDHTFPPATITFLAAPNASNPACQ